MRLVELVRSRGGGKRGGRGGIVDLVVFSLGFVRGWFWCYLGGGFCKIGVLGRWGWDMGCEGFGESFSEREVKDVVEGIIRVFGVDRRFES